MIVILPDRDVDLGLMTEGDRVITVPEETPFGIRYNALKLPKDDPQCQ